MQILGSYCAFIAILAIKNAVSTITPVTTATKHRKYSFYSTFSTASTVNVDNTTPLHEFPRNRIESNGVEIKTKGSEVALGMPPREFPEFIQNSNQTLVNELLAHSKNNSQKADRQLPTMIFDLPRHFVNEMKDAEIQDFINKAGQVEGIDDEKQTEDVLRHPQAKSMSSQQSEESGVHLVEGRLAAILAGVFVCICVCAYVGLLLWRRHLERRYGNRHLIMEDDDVNYFSV